MKNRSIIHIVRSLLPILILLVSLSAGGQNGDLIKSGSSNASVNVKIGSIVDLQEAYIRDSYSEKIEAPKELINGKEYEPYYTRSKNKPLLFFDKARTASILTKTRRYNNLTLQYDTFLDEVIYTDTSRTINSRFPQIALNKNILYGFNLYFQDDSLNFKYIRLSESSGKNLKEGFYEIVYEGKSKYLIKHKSSFYVREGMNEYKYSHNNYISTGDIFYEINTRKSLLRLFGEKSSEIKGFLHSSGIKVRKADKSQFLHIVKFYDSLVASK